MKLSQMADEDETDFPEFASPPCFMHELSREASLTASRSDSWSDVARWRNAERRRLIGERMTLAAADRIARSKRLAEKLDEAVGKVSGRIVSSYWPYRGEPDLRNWAIKVIERGGRIALPVVVQKARPLEFRVWQPGDPLERGIWNILVPSRGPAVLPDIVVAPVVGFDAANYRLGHGGGYFDRTLAAMPHVPLKIGIGFATAEIATIYPQPHDIPMDTIVTD
jgi:5-formyltetrahydrofolate cyclo-ligase